MNRFATLSVSAFMLLGACSTTYLSTGAPRKCPIRMAGKPMPAGKGVVTKLLTQAEAMALLSSTEAKVGAPIDGAYINNVRAIVRGDDGRVKTVLVPYGMTVDVGDRISFQSSYVSSPQVCSYVPTLATGKI